MRTRRIRRRRPAGWWCACARARSTISISGSAAGSIASTIPLPHISGADVAGEIADVGDGVSGWRAATA